MSSFTTPLIVEMLANENFKIMEEFSFYVGDIDNNEIIAVPRGFITDLATVPKIFWFFLPPTGEYGKAAVLHDYLYANAIESKLYADNIFLEAMKVLGVGKIKRTIMYYAVRLFGNGTY